MFDYGNTLEDIMIALGLDILDDSDWAEFKSFWLSLTRSERAYYRNTKLG